MNANSFTGVIYIVISAIGFSIMGICGRVAYSNGMNLSSLLAWRFFVASLILWPIIIYHKSFRGVSFKQIRNGFLLGGLGFWGVANLYFTSIKYNTTGMTSILLYTYPSFVAFNAWIILKRRPSIRMIYSIVICLVGTTLIANIFSSSLINISKVGILIGISMAAYYSLYIMVAELVGKNIPTEFLSGVIVSGACISFFIQSVLKSELLFPMNLASWTAVIALGLFSTVFAIHFFMMGITLLGSVKTSIISSIESVFTIVIGIIFLNEVITLEQVIGVTLILIALAISLYTKKISS